MIIVKYVGFVLVTFYEKIGWKDTYIHRIRKINLVFSVLFSIRLATNFFIL